jgi:hypothetical protein
VNEPAMIRRRVYTRPDPGEEAEPEAVGLIEVTADQISLVMYGSVVYRGSLEHWAWSQVMVDGEISQ